MPTRLLIASLALACTLSAGNVVDRLSPQHAEFVEKKSNAAQTAKEHLEAATLHDERAAAFTAKAVRHEERAAELDQRKTYNPMRQKWPAMVEGPIERERHLAMQARRAAVESRQLAAKHRRAAADQS
ncbi:MAG: hypothetical protein IT162_12960 [Bryobacterales bacterium]|nr:hypothetical protein [Bryobacterales bacterium]